MNIETLDIATQPERKIYTKISMEKFPYSRTKCSEKITEDKRQYIFEDF